MTKAKNSILVTVTIDDTRIDIKDNGYGWVSGVFGEYLFWAKISNEGTGYGIEEGRVYKLNIRRFHASEEE